MKDKMFNSQGSVNAGVRMLENGNDVFLAFESLDLGWTKRDLMRYVRAPMRRNLPKLSVDEYGRVIGMLAAAMILAVEQERANRNAS